MSEFECVHLHVGQREHVCALFIEITRVTEFFPMNIAFYKQPRLAPQLSFLSSHLIWLPSLSICLYVQKYIFA